MAFHPTPDADTKWGVVIVYDDAPAGQYAIQTVDVVTQQLNGRMQLYPSLWRFDFLEDSAGYTAATADAVQAGLLIISTSNKSELPATVQNWVRECLQSESGAPGALVALLGPAGDLDQLDSPRVRFLKGAAEAAGRSFFAPAPRVTHSQPVAASSRGPARSAYQILVVENDNMIRQANAAILAQAGYQVVSVENSQAAWEALLSSRFDLLITDNQMPGMTGLELVRKLRATQLALPVVMASGGVDEGELSQNQWLQPTTVLPKPFTSDALLQMVTGILGQAGRAAMFCDPHSHWGLNE